MNHRLGRLLFALATGLLVAWLSWRWITDPAPREQRALEDAMVLEARAALRRHIGPGEWHIVDPLNPNRVAGKVFIYPASGGWEVSGYYRSGDSGPWRPWLVSLNDDGEVLEVRAEHEPSPQP